MKQETCPRCKRSLSTVEDDPPAFCMYCGQKLRESAGSPGPGGMLTASHVPFSSDVEEEAPEPPPSEVGGYRLLRFLGAGGMGAVYEAEAFESGERVAVKLLSSRLSSNPTSIERFRQEGRLASQLSHPRCVFVLAADTDAGRPYIVMELMPGRTLKDQVDQNGPLPPDEAIEGILDVIDGLAEAHRLGVLHRDVKPSNCFLTAEGRVKVGDFGLSKSLAGSGDRHITQSGAFLGTVLFASPEQIRGEPLDYTSDIYSVCATLYYLLQGEAPYQHESMTAALAKAISEAPPSICKNRPDVSRALERVVMRGLERDRERRWQSLDDLREALVDLLPSRQTPARPRAIVSAYVIDLLILLIAALIPLKILHSVLNWSSLRVAGLDFDPVWWALSVSYFATFEGLMGRTPGKWLLGLRVSGLGRSGPPGLERGWVRAGAFSLMIYWLTYAPGLLGESLGDVAGLVAFCLGLFAWLFQLRRTEGGYRGLHDFVSGCHLTQKPLPVRRLRLISRLPSPLDAVASLDETEMLPTTLGGFAIKGRLWADAASGQQVWSAEDRALGRRVLVWLMPDDGNPSTPIPYEAPRPARLRRLGRGSLRFAGRDLEWVAFAAPVGAPLQHTVRKPLPWADARQVLEELVEELQASGEDGSTPARMALGQVWVEPNGRIHLLDFPVSSGQEPPCRDPFELIRQASTLLLEGNPRANLEAPSRSTPTGVRAPLPPHAAPIFAKLFSTNGYASLGDLQHDLQATHLHSPEVTPGIRAAHLGMQTAFLGIGLLLMYLAAGAVGVLLIVSAQRHSEAAEQALADLSDPGTHEELKRVPGAEAAIGNPRARARIEAVLLQNRTESEARMSRMLAPQRLAVQTFGRTNETRPNSRQDMLHDESELFVWSAAKGRSAEGRGASPWGFRAGPIWAVIVIIPLIWIGAAAVFRGGISMLIAGIAVMRSDGRRAYRSQCALRAGLVWLPVVLVLLASVWVQIYRFQYAYLAAGLWLIAVALLPAYVILAIRYPNRPPQDRFAGTHLVPE